MCCFATFLYRPHACIRTPVRKQDMSKGIITNQIRIKTKSTLKIEIRKAKMIFKGGAAAGAASIAASAVATTYKVVSE